MTNEKRVVLFVWSGVGAWSSPDDKYLEGVFASPAGADKKYRQLLEAGWETQDLGIEAVELQP